MYATDFEYDGRLLSSYGFTICEFGGDGSLNTLDTGYNITFNKVSRNHGRKHGLASTSYEECAEATFQICKDACDDDFEISNDEYRELARWLNRHEFLRFRLLDETEGGDREPCYFNASFNIRKMYVADKLYGLELVAETDAPYGYGAPIEKEWVVAAGDTVVISDMSDDIGQISPDITITCGAGGTLTVTNQKCASEMQIKNCSSGEVINIYGDTQIITSSLESHNICNDFNYEFLKIGNTHDDRRNPITISLPCTFQIKYAPIIKDIP